MAARYHGGFARALGECCGLCAKLSKQDRHHHFGCRRRLQRGRCHARDRRRPWQDLGTDRCGYQSPGRQRQHRRTCRKRSRRRRIYALYAGEFDLHRAADDSPQPSGQAAARFPAGRLPRRSADVHCRQSGVRHRVDAAADRSRQGGAGNDLHGGFRRGQNNPPDVDLDCSNGPASPSSLCRIRAVHPSRWPTWPPAASP